MSHLICVECGKEFEEKRSDAKTCGKACRKAHSRGGRRPRKCDTYDLQPMRSSLKYYNPEFCERCQEFKNPVNDFRTLNVYRPGRGIQFRAFEGFEHQYRVQLCSRCFQDGWDFDENDEVYKRSCSHQEEWAQGIYDNAARWNIMVKHDFDKNSYPKE